MVREGNLFLATSTPMLVAMVGKLLSLAFAIALARALGAEDLGMFAFAIGVATVGGRVFALGLPTLSQQLLPVFQISSDRIGRNQLISFSDATLACSGLVGGLLLVLAAEISGAPDSTRQSCLFAAAMLPAMAFRALLRNQIISLGSASKAISLDEIVPPLICLTSLVWLSSAAAVSVVYAFASFIAVLIGFKWRSAELIGFDFALPAVGRGLGWLRASLPSMVGMTSKLLISRVDVLLLGAMASFVETGLYTAALKVTFVQTAPMVVVATVMTPLFSHYIARGEMVACRRQFWTGIVAALSLSLPFALLFTFFSETIIAGFFGGDFLEAAEVLPILGLAQVGAAISLVTSGFILMAGEQRKFSAITTTTLFLLIMLHALLIPRFGMQGAAYATAISVLCMSSVQFLFAIRILAGRIK